MGKFSADVGQKFDSTCEVCPKGAYCPDEASFEPTPCVAGKWSATTGLTSSSACSSCEAGKFSRHVGQTSDSTCTICPQGSHCPTEASSDPTPCAAGTFSTATGLASASDCTPCERGSHQLQTGETSCDQCPPGSYQNDPGEINCKQCGRGTSQSLSGKTSCPKCRPGTYQNANGQEECLPCVEGFVCTAEGTEDPVACSSEDGTAEYCPPGSSTAIRCALGHYCESSHEMLECVANGNFCPEGSTHPKSCPDGNVCSLAVSCANDSIRNLWYNEPQPSGGTGGSGADLSNLPSCQPKNLTATILDGGLMKLGWEKVDCADFDAAFTATSVNGFATRSYLYR